MRILFSKMGAATARLRRGLSDERKNGRSTSDMTIERMGREVMARALLWSGLCELAKRFLWRDRVAMLLYHDPSPETLDNHLTYLKRFCDIVSFSEIDRPGRARPRAVITLDDGCAGNARLLPIFIKHDVRPTIFICSQIVGAGRQFWWQHSGAEVEGHNKLKRLPNAERLELLKRHGYGMLSVGHTISLSTADIEQMKPWVDFQAHTRFHPILPMCDDAECASEISLSREEIERLVGTRCVHFAYPNGNYGSREVEYVKAAGYQYARTCDVGWNDLTTDPYRLKCIPVDDAASVSWFAAKLSGIPLFLRYMANGSFDGKMPQY